jgi:hypothetical protein
VIVAGSPLTRNLSFYQKQWRQKRQASPSLMVAFCLFDFDRFNSKAEILDARSWDDTLLRSKRKNSKTWALCPEANQPEPSELGAKLTSSHLTSQTSPMVFFSMTLQAVGFEFAAWPLQHKLSVDQHSKAPFLGDRRCSTNRPLCVGHGVVERYHNKDNC